VYGVRVADSRFGYKSLGKSRNISKAQHCRAEVFLGRFGWVPVDPADVRKVVREGPPGKLALDHPKVLAVRRQLFGAWEMNWLAYNVAHDLRLPGRDGPQLPFLMYPQGRARAGSLRQPRSGRLPLLARLARADVVRRGRRFRRAAGLQPFVRGAGGRPFSAARRRCGPPRRRARRPRAPPARVRWI
jgi:hypothetical protein